MQQQKVVKLSKGINPWYLTDFRKKRGMNQSEFAQAVGVGQQMISKYECGKKPLSLNTYRKFKSKLGYCPSQSGRLRFLIDYLRITFMSVRDLNHFTMKYLGIPFKEFHDYETGLMRYNRLWKRGDIWLFDYHDKYETNNYQITLQLSGAGCRQMEVMLDYYDIDWLTFFKQLKDTYQDDLRVTRLDIAIDELYLGSARESEQFDLNSLVQKSYTNELFFDKLKTWNYIGGGGVRKAKDGSFVEEPNGLSIYFGSRQSEMYFNFYEKRYELAKKERLTADEAAEIFDIWNRFEIRLAHKKADSVIEEYLNGVDLAEIARGLINSRLDVYDGTNQFGAYLADQKWQALFGGVEPLQLTTKPEPYNIRKTINWLRYQIANSLVLVKKYDKLMNENNFAVIFNSGELTPEMEKLLLQVQIDVERHKGEYENVA